MVKASTKREREPASFPQGREMLLSVMENAPIGMSLVDWDGRTVFINQACADMFRTSRAELAALSLSDIIVPEMLEDSAAALQAIIGSRDRIGAAGGSGSRASRSAATRAASSVRKGPSS